MAKCKCCSSDCVVRIEIGIILWDYVPPSVVNMSRLHVKIYMSSGKIYAGSTPEVFNQDFSDSGTLILNSSQTSDTIIFQYQYEPLTWLEMGAQPKTTTVTLDPLTASGFLRCCGSGANIPTAYIAVNSLDTPAETSSMEGIYYCL